MATIKKETKIEYQVGTPESQIETLGLKITELSEHLKSHKKDFSSRRGLLQMVNKRRRLLSYLKGKDEKSFETMTKKMKETKG